MPSVPRISSGSTTDVTRTRIHWRWKSMNEWMNEWLSIKNVNERFHATNLESECNAAGINAQLCLPLSLSRWVTLIALLLRNSRLHNSVSMATLGGRSQSVQLGMFKCFEKSWEMEKHLIYRPLLLASLFLSCTCSHLLPEIPINPSAFNIFAFCWSVLIVFVGSLLSRNASPCSLVCSSKRHLTVWKFLFLVFAGRRWSADVTREK